MKRTAVVLLFWVAAVSGEEHSDLPGAERYMHCSAVSAFMAYTARKMKPDEEKARRIQAELYI